MPTDAHPPMEEDSGLFAFVEETAGAAATRLADVGPASLPAWRILVVDDDPDVHVTTRYALESAQVLGRPLQLLFAFSAAQARALLLQEQDLALVLLDVVMETESAGLDLVAFIRQVASMRATRIVLRTGQPGYAPEYDTVVRYDINDYKAKSEMTHLRLLTTVTAAVRSYQQLRLLESSQRGLELITRAWAGFEAGAGVQRFAETVLVQVQALLGMRADGQVSGRGACAPAPATVLARCGRRFESALLDGPPAMPQTLVDAAFARGATQARGRELALFLGEAGVAEMVVHLLLPQPVTGLQQELLGVYCATASAWLRNLCLFERLQTQAFMDVATQLPNRARFIQDIDAALADPQARMALALVDIDDFGAVNDLMGHAYADRLLAAYAERLRRSGGAGDGVLSVARLGSNTFGLLGAADSVVPERVLSTVREPLLVDGAPHKIGVTSGLALLQPGLQGGDDWIKDVYLALKTAKRHSRGSHVMFTPNMGQESRARAQLLANLHAAFSSQRLFLMYQPQIDLRSRALIGLEALARWRGEDGRLIPPDQFIAVAEQSGLILPLGDWVLRTACATMQQLVAQGLAPQRMAVNVSVVQFQRPEFVAAVTQALADTGLPGGRLELEITESVAMLGSVAVQSKLAALRDLGVAVAVDDFGTGYSSLSYLDRLPIDRIKIDRAFVSHIDDAQGPRIAEMITQLGLKLGVQVLAEGVETEEALLMLRAMGCHEGQGYHIARPMPLETLLTWLAQQAATQA